MIIFKKIFTLLGIYSTIYINKIKSLINLYFFSQSFDAKKTSIQLKNYLRFKINDGPFKGMSYISKSSGSVFLPKITGTYECELHDVIQEIYNSNYTLLIDVGAAEGYYAAGFAYLNRNNSKFKVLAYDIDSQAKENLSKLIRLNKLVDKVSINHLFELELLKKFNSDKKIIICDIEGGEKELLDPHMEPLLLDCDILVEIHDGIDSNQIKNLLRNRFENSHNIRHIKFDQNNSFRKNYLSWISNRVVLNAIANEGRVYGLDWFFITKNKT
jgi:hypothetical protein